MIPSELEDEFTLLSQHRSNAEDYERASQDYERASIIQTLSNLGEPISFTREKMSSDSHEITEPISAEDIAKEIKILFDVAVRPKQVIIPVETAQKIITTIGLHPVKIQIEKTFVTVQVLVHAPVISSTLQ
jgi:hypothetical protein